MICESPYPGINRKVLNKTRIVKKFVWNKKLKGERRILQNAYILQKCLKNQYGIETGGYNDFYLDWYDCQWAEKQNLFLKCVECDNELIASGSFVSEDGTLVKYKCTDCDRETTWVFSGPAPFTIL